MQNIHHAYRGPAPFGPTRANEDEMGSISTNAQHTQEWHELPGALLLAAARPFSRVATQNPSLAFQLQVS